LFTFEHLPLQLNPYGQSVKGLIQNINTCCKLSSSNTNDE